MKKIPIAGPSITQKEIDYVTDAVTNAWYENANVYNQKFERAFAAYLGRKYAVTLPSCTSAIHLALAAAGVGAGDEVIIPDLTWIASAAPISYVGARPVFVDAELDSWCVSPEAIAAHITPRTKAIIAVDLYGNLPNLKAIKDLAKKHDLLFIEDAAEALGSEYHGRKAGALGDVGVFSFHGSKTLTTGEGGMLVTDDDDLFQRVMILRDHGRKPEPRLFWNHEVAYKYKMSNLQAALGLAQLERIEELVARKREIFSWYKESLGGIPGVQLNPEPVGCVNSYWMSTIVWDEKYGVQKDEVIARLASDNVDTRPFFYPLSMLPAYKDLYEESDMRQKNKNTYRIGLNGINLPSAMSLREDEAATVCKAVKRIFGR